jgi:hypothetical protein
MDQSFDGPHVNEQSEKPDDPKVGVSSAPHALKTIKCICCHRLFANYKKRADHVGACRLKKIITEKLDKLEPLLRVNYKNQSEAMISSLDQFVKEQSAISRKYQNAYLLLKHEEDRDINDHKIMFCKNRLIAISDQLGRLSDNINTALDPATYTYTSYTYNDCSNSPASTESQGNGADEYPNQPQAKKRCTSFSSKGFADGVSADTLNPRCKDCVVASIIKSIREPTGSQIELPLIENGLPLAEGGLPHPVTTPPVVTATGSIVPSPTYQPAEYSTPPADVAIDDIYTTISCPDMLNPASVAVHGVHELAKYM